MSNFEKMFAEAVKVLLEEKDDKAKSDEKGKAKQTSTKSATGMVAWSPGPGRWSDVIRGLKDDAKLPYEQAIAKSSASGGRSKTLMAKLGISKPSSSDNPIEAAGQILVQAVKSPAMAAVFGTPGGSKAALTVPITISTSEEDVASGEGISARNVAVYIHLTLIGAYNAGMLKINEPIRIAGVSKGATSITITR